MKTKDNEIDMVPAGSNWFANRAQRKSLEVVDSTRGIARVYPYPGCFAKRGCKLLKTNDGSYEKSAKRVKESANV